MYRPRELTVKEFLKGESKPNISLSYNRRKKRKRCESVKNFCRTTANHGFAHLVNQNELLVLRIVWGIVIACFTSIVILLVYQSVRNLLNRTLTTEFLEREDHNDAAGVILPDIHICDASIFNDSRLKEMGFDNRTATYLTLATSDNAVRQSILNDTRRLKALKDKFDRILANGNLTMANVIKKAAIKCEGIVAKCTHAGINYNADECCTKFFHPESFVSIFGSCISTHGKEIKQMYASRDAGFVVYIVPNTNDIISFDESLIKPEYILQKGLYYAVSSPAIHIEAVLHTGGRFAAPNSWVSVPITKSVVDNSELKDNILAPHTCVHTNDLLYVRRNIPEYDYYSEFNCYLSHMQKLYRQAGNCSVVFCNYGKNKLDCPIECISEVYDILPSYAEFNTQFLTRRAYPNLTKYTILLGKKTDNSVFNFPLNSFQPVVLHFFYSTFTYQVRISHTYTFLKWLGEVGGNLGLFLGASLISILEIVVLFFRCCLKWQI